MPNSFLLLFLSTLRKSYIKKIPAAETKSGQRWRASIIPSDGGTYGELYQTPSIIINTPPYLNPHPNLSPLGQRAGRHLFMAYRGYNDIDNDPPAYFGANTKWYVNTKHVGEYDGLFTLPKNQTFLGEVWYVAVAPFDGIDHGAFIKTNLVTITNNTDIYLPLIMKNFPLLNSNCTLATAFEENDTFATACALYPTPINNALVLQQGGLYLEDEDDMFRLELHQAANLEIAVTSYTARGQVLLYSE